MNNQYKSLNGLKNSSFVREKYSSSGSSKIINHSKKNNDISVKWKFCRAPPNPYVQEQKRVWFEQDLY